MLANWIKQKSLTSGTSDVELGVTVDGFIAASSVYSNNDRIFYSIVEGENRENGLGTYISGSNSISRDEIFETLTNGIFDNSNPAPLNLFGEAVVSVTATTRGLTTHQNVWGDIQSNAFNNPESGYTAPSTATLIGGIQVAGFSPTVVNSIGVNFCIPHSINPDEDLIPHIRWSPSDADTGTVRWGFEFSGANVSTGFFINNVILYVEQVSSGVANQHKLIDFTAIPPLLPDAVIHARVFRDATHVNDTYTGSALLNSITLHANMNTVGTPSLYPNFYSWS